MLEILDGRYFLSFAKDGHSLNNVLEFAYVPWPGIVFELLERMRGELPKSNGMFPASEVKEVAGQKNDVFSPISERGH